MTTYDRTPSPRPARAAAALLSILLAAPLAALAAEARTLERADDQGRVASGRLVGTWEFQVTFVQCDTGTPVAPTFTSLHTYLPGGSALEQGSTAGRPPAISRTVGQGVWERESPGLFHAIYKFFAFDVNGQLVSRVEIDELVEFQSGDEIIHYGVGRVFNPAGVEVTSNCFTGTGVRMALPE